MFFIGVGSKCSQNLWLNIQTKVCIFRLVNHVALNVNSKLGELYAKRILEKFEKKETSENNFENKNGSFNDTNSYFCENDKILKEKEAELDNFVHQPPRGGRRASAFEPIHKNSNHIEFVDYIHIHKVITYKHLFAYGFYIF